MQLIVATILALAFFPFSPGNNFQKSDQASKDEQELRKLEDEWLSSYLRGDRTTFDRIVADDFTGTDESARVRNKAEERELIQPPPASIKSSLANEDVRVRTNGDAAIVTGRIVLKTQLSGQPEISFQTRFTDTFLRRQGRWQVAARHYSRLPPERVAVKLDPKVFDEYVGQYELAQDFVLIVTKEGDKLMSQATGQPKFELLPESDIAFFIKDISALLIFMRGQNGEINRMITVQDGRIVSAKKIK
jgi:ketosteroid isomerase-like protein